MTKKFPEELRGLDTRELSRIFRLFLNTPKNLLKSSYEKNTCQNFPTQKKPEIENFKPIKIFRSSLSLEIRSTPLPPPPAGGTFFLNLHRIGHTVFLGLCLRKLTRIHEDSNIYFEERRIIKSVQRV